MASRRTIWGFRFSRIKHLVTISLNVSHASMNTLVNRYNETVKRKDPLTLNYKTRASSLHHLPTRSSRGDAIARGKSSCYRTIPAAASPGAIFFPDDSKKRFYSYFTRSGETTGEPAGRHYSPVFVSSPCSPGNRWTKCCPSSWEQVVNTPPVSAGYFTSQVSPLFRRSSTERIGEVALTAVICASSASL